MSIQDLQHVAYVQITDSMLDEGYPCTLVIFQGGKLYIEGEFEDGISEWVEV